MVEPQQAANHAPIQRVVEPQPGPIQRMAKPPQAARSREELLPGCNLLKRANRNTGQVDRLEPIMNCKEFEEISGAYALDAVTSEEREAAQTHLAQCPTCTFLLRELRSAVALLPL